MDNYMMSVVPDLVVKNKPYELLELGLGNIMDINLITRITRIKDLSESVKLLRLFSNTSDRANLLLKTASISFKYDARNEVIKWSLAHGADPNISRTKTPLSIGEESCFQYYISMYFLGSFKINTIRLMLDAEPDMNSEMWVSRTLKISSNKKSLHIALENIDLAELEYTCLVAILVEANF